MSPSCTKRGGLYLHLLRALIAVAVGVIPVLPGFINAATTEGGIIADPNFFDQLYRYGVFVAFGLSGMAYVTLAAISQRAVRRTRAASLEARP